MPNRVIREGFLDSDKINSLSEQEQNFFVRLMLIADDYGRHDARSNLLSSKCYPLSDMRPSIVSQMTDQLNCVGLIQLYEVNNKKYLEIIQFNQRLRQKRLKFPPPGNGKIIKNAVNGQPNDSQVTARKEKNLKRKESESEKKPKDDFDIALKDFEEMRKKQRKPLTEKAKGMILKKLETLSTDRNKQIEILNQSTMNSWASVFPLKDKENKSYGFQNLDTRELIEDMKDIVLD